MKTVREFIRTHGYACLAFLTLLIFLFYPNVGIYDWDKEVLYTAYIKSALLDFKSLPLFLWNSGELAGYPAVDQSALFAANPETMLFSPFLSLLLLLSPANFLKVLVVLNAVVGYAGVLRLGKKLGWRKNSIRIFSALFLLSPIVIQHVAIGYLPWVNLYLFPWLLVCLLAKDGTKRVLGSGMVLALVLLQGGLHVFVWMAFFSIFFFVLSAVLKKSIGELLQGVLALLTAVLLALPRFYLSLQSFSSFSQRFFAGYSARAFLQWALAPPFFTPASMDDIEYFIEGYIDGVPYWDGEVFWGLLILLVALLPFFFIYKKKDTTVRSTSLAVAGSSALLLLFSFGNIYQTLITFVAELLRLPALEGMEKYPFRFAIPAYYGFAFVIAHHWNDLPDFFQHCGQILFAVWKKMVLLARHLAGWLGKRQRKLNWLAGIFLLLCALAWGLKNPLLDQVHTIISTAYAGQGAAWLAARMEHTGNIAVESYLSKADTLYAYGLRVLSAVTALCVLGWLGGRMRLSVQEEVNSQRKAFSLPEWLLEALLVLPLLLAYGMWWRVALATPQNTLSELSVEAPVLSSLAGDALDGVEILSFSPTGLQIMVDAEGVGETIIFQDVPANDVKFLESDRENLVFVEEGDRLALKVEETGIYSIRVKNSLVALPCMAAGAAWILCAVLLLRKNKNR